MTEPIVVERRVKATPERVYAYLTVSENWAKWQGVAADVDARPGGSFSMTMGNGMRARGQFVELVPASRVVFSWGWIDHPGVPPGSTTVEVDLLPYGDETVIRLTHRGLPPEEIGIHRAGWDHYLPRLTTVAEGGDAGPDTGPG